MLTIKINTEHIRIVDANEPRIRQAMREAFRRVGAMILAGELTMVEPRSWEKFRFIYKKRK